MVAEKRVAACEQLAHIMTLVAKRKRAIEGITAVRRNAQRRDWKRQTWRRPIHIVTSLQQVCKVAYMGTVASFSARLLSIITVVAIGAIQITVAQRFADASIELQHRWPVVWKICATARVNDVMVRETQTEIKAGIARIHLAGGQIPENVSPRRFLCLVGIIPVALKTDFVLVAGDLQTIAILVHAAYCGQGGCERAPGG
jgi:hypothetical protein